MSTRQILGIFMLFLPGLIKSQTNPKWLVESVVNAEIVVEGTILEQRYFLDSTTQNIFTVHTLMPHHVFKGMTGMDYLYVRTEGGCIDGRCQTLSHNVRIDNNEKGIYCLEQSGATSETYTKIYYGLTGGDRIKKVEDHEEMEAYCQSRLAKFPSWRKLREEIAILCGQNIGLARVGKQQLDNAFETQFCVKIANAKPVFGQKKVEFDVYAKSNIDGLEFEGVDLVFYYPADLLGDSVVSEGKVALQPEVISANAIYDLSLADKSASSFGINISASCQVSDVRYKLSTEYEKLAHIVVDVQEWSALGNISIEDFSVVGQAEYYLDQSDCFEFGYLCVENGLVPLGVCEITSYSTAPFGAGVRDLINGNQQTITFKGNGFGNGILGKMEVPNADDGGASNLTIFGLFDYYIESWPDTEIEVFISSNFGGTIPAPPMGSGDWKIFPAELLGCIEKVDIDYSLLNSRHLDSEDKMISLAKELGKVPSGAVEWYIYEPSLPAGVTLATIEAVAQQAFCDWELASNIEFKYLGPTTSISSTDERITIYFGVPANNSAAAVTNIIFSLGACDSYLFFTSRIRDNNILFNSTLSWYINTGTSPGSTQVDFYSILMHEKIGHAIGLDHAMDTDLTNGTADSRLMYYSLNNAQVKRNIDAKSLRGADDLADRTEASLASSLPDCYGTDSYGFSRAIDGCATPTDDISEPFAVNLLNNFIERGDNLWLISGQQMGYEIHVYDLTGRRVITKSLILDIGQTAIPTNEMAAGYYTLTVVSSGQQKSFLFFVK